MIPGWTPDHGQGAKEILYRCLEELQATKAALYLAGDTGAFELVTQYGFGKHDALAADVSTGSPLWDWVRRHRTGPAFLNDAAPFRDIKTYLAAAGTTKLLTIPLVAGTDLVGFIDARDKARRVPFEQGDTVPARRIAAAVEELLFREGFFAPAPGAELELDAPAAPVGAGGAVPPTAALAAGPDPAAVRELSAALRSLVPTPGIAAALLTLTDGTSVRALALNNASLEPSQQQAMATHQVHELGGCGLRVPPPDLWGWSHEDAGGRETRCEVLSTTILRAGPPLWVVLSLLTPEGSDAAGPVTAVARQVVSLACRLADYRHATRNLARRLLEPGDTSYLHLRRHSQAVSELALRMSASLGLDEETEELVTVAAYLHDVGMRELEYGRLYRLDRPSEADRRAYQRHPTVGAHILEESGFPGDLSGAVRHHHERWDGTGYPDRLAGGAIPLASRIIHLCEVFDALTSPSSYRPALGQDTALSRIRNEAGRQFDPELVPVLERVVRS